MVQVHDPLSLVQEYLSFAAVVHRLTFIGAVPSLVLWIFQNVPDAHLLISIEMKNPADYLRFRFIDGENAVFLSYPHSLSLPSTWPF